MMCLKAECNDHAKKNRTPCLVQVFTTLSNHINLTSPPKFPCLWTGNFPMRKLCTILPTSIPVLPNRLDITVKRHLFCSEHTMRVGHYEHLIGYLCIEVALILASMEYLFT